jgi:glycosyltransferase involved in cell wall biosynthesis
LGNISPSLRGCRLPQGEYVVVMDCDLQDPPELIPAMLNKLHEGFDLVLGRRVVRNHSRFRTMMAAGYFWAMSWISDYKIDGTEGSFRCLRARLLMGICNLVNVNDIICLFCAGSVFVKGYLILRMSNGLPAKVHTRWVD